MEYTKEICRYLYETYGRFPAHTDAFNLPGLWVQVANLELEYYDKYANPATTAARPSGRASGGPERYHCPLMGLTRRTVLAAGGAGLVAVAVPERVGQLLSSSAWASTAPADLTLERFAPDEGSRFDVRVSPGHKVPVTLIEAADRPGRRPDRRGPSGSAFTLLFGGSAPKAFGDGIYTLVHPSLGSISLFLVPVGRAVAGQRYEAVVNRRAPAGAAA